MTSKVKSAIKVSLFLIVGFVAGVVSFWIMSDPGSVRRTENMLLNEGLAPMSVEINESGMPYFTAIIQDAPWCTVRGMQSASSERWMLYGYNDAPDEYDNNSDWPNKGVTFAELAESTPGICVNNL